MQTDRWDQVKEIFTSAAALPINERHAFLESACADDPGLRSEVESLLSAYTDDSFIERPAVQRSGLEFAATNWIGRRLGPYRIVGEVDRGGMSEVYRAIRDDNQYQKDVAIKLLRHGFDTESLLVRSRVERQILAQLSHPNIAHLLDGGTTEEGKPYLVMEYIQGQPMDVYCERQKLGIHARLELFRTLCGAVHYVHQHLMVHGDLKCNNVLVTDRGVVQLLDFGIARLLNPTPALAHADARVTGFVALTPDYASPEQICGEPITTASDVYSLGILLYRLLAGRLPFQVRGMASYDLATQVREQPPCAPSATAATGAESYKRFARHIEGDLDSIILKALRKAPQERYSSVEQLSEDVQRYLLGFPVRAYSDEFSYRVRKFVRRHQVATAAMSLFIISLFAGIAATSWQSHIAQRERARAEHHFDSVRKLSNSYMMEIHGAIENLSGSTAARRLILETSLRHLSELSKEADDNPVVRRDLANAYEKVGDIQGRFRGANLGDTAGAVESYRKALRTRESLLKDDAGAQLQRDLVRTHGKLSELLMVQNEPNVATKHLHQVARMATALATAPNATAEDRRNLANAYVSLGWQRAALGDTEEGISTMRDALPIYREVIAANANDHRAKRNLALTLQRIGDALAGQTDRYEEAVRDISESLLILEKLLGAEPNNADLTRVYAYTLLSMGDALLKQGSARDALRRHENAYELFEAMRVTDPANAEAPFPVAYALGRMSEALVELNQLQQAFQRASRAETTLRHRISTADHEPLENHYYTGLVHFQLGKVHARLAAENDLGQNLRKEHRHQARTWLREGNEALKRATHDAMLGARAKTHIAEAEALLQELSDGPMCTPPCAIPDQ